MKMHSNPTTFAQLEPLPAADPPEAPQQAQKRCIGLIVDSNNIVVRCPELVPPSRNNQRKYHFRTCRYRTGRLRRRGFSAGDKLLLPPKRCTGWALQDGLIVVCGKLFTPSRGNQKYHSTECYVWTWNRRLNGVVLGDTYVKGGHTQQHPPKSCKGWIIRDGVIAKCLVPSTGSGNKEYHSTACLFRTRRWRVLGYHLNDSVRRTCAYRNCHKGEGGARRTFDRIHRSLRSGDYFCDQRCRAAEQRARQAEEVEGMEGKLAEAERILALGLHQKRKRGKEGETTRVTDARITLAACRRRQGMKDYDIAPELYPLHERKADAWNSAKNAIFKNHDSDIKDEERRVATLSDSELTMQITAVKQLIPQRLPKAG